MFQNSLAGIGRNSAIAAIGMLLNGPISFLTTICLAHWLGVNDFGLYTLLLTIAGIMAGFSTLGMQVGVARYIAHYIGLDQADKAAAVYKTLSLISVTFSMITAITLWEVSPFIAAFFQKPNLVPYLRIISLSIPALVLQDVWLYTLRGLQKIGSQTIIEKIVTPALMITLTLSFYFLHRDLQGYLYGVVVLNYLIVGFLGWSTWKEFDKSRGISIQKSETLKWLGYSFPVLLEKLIQLFLTQAGLEILLIAHYGTAADVGIYGLLYQIMPFMMLPATAFSIAFGPTVSALHAQGKTQTLKQNFVVVNRWIATFTIPLFLLLIIWSKQILRLNGNGFESGQLALCILAVGFLVDALVGEVRGIMLMTGKSGMFLLNSGGLMILNLMLNLWFIPRWGIVGAAIAGAVSRASLNLIGLAQVFIFIRIHPFNRDYLKPIAAAVITSAIYLLTLAIFPSEGMKETIWRSIALILIYPSSIAVLGLPGEELAAIGFVRRHITNGGYGNVSR